MGRSMKIIAYYLPQFHTFPENDAWWGTGFTEWNNVRTASPLFEGHAQPRKPLKGRYYDLSDREVQRWQAGLAREYGIYGFCYYHYWFEGKLLMQKPLENMLYDKTIDLPFCISWANEDFTRSWAQKKKELLLKQTYGKEEDWKRHFEYLLPFFTDERYIRIDDRPVFIIYRPELIEELYPMLELWNAMAAGNGLKGMKYIYQQVFYNHLTDRGGELFDYGIEYQPTFVKRQMMKTPKVIGHKIRNQTANLLHRNLSERSAILYDYDETWERILRLVPRDEKMIPGAFVDWDNTPRYKSYSSICYGYSAEKFERYLTKQIVRARDVYHKDLIFLFAWNEWGEGGYLEPDETDGYGRLEAVKRALAAGNLT